MVAKDIFKETLAEPVYANVSDLLVQAIHLCCYILMVTIWYIKKATSSIKTLLHRENTLDRIKIKLLLSKESPNTRLTSHEILFRAQSMVRHSSWKKYRDTNKGKYVGLVDLP